MAKKNQGPGIQSAAGLIRYYDSEEESKFQMGPATILVVSLVVGAAVVLARLFLKYTPG